MLRRRRAPRLRIGKLPRSRRDRRFEHLKLRRSAGPPPRRLQRTRHGGSQKYGHRADLGLLLDHSSHLPPAREIRKAGTFRPGVRADIRGRGNRLRPWHDVDGRRCLSDGTIPDEPPAKMASGFMRILRACRCTPFACPNRAWPAETKGPATPASSSLERGRTGRPRSTAQFAVSLHPRTDDPVNWTVVVTWTRGHRRQREPSLRSVATERGPWGGRTRGGHFPGVDPSRSRSRQRDSHQCDSRMLDIAV